MLAFGVAYLLEGQFQFAALQVFCLLFCLLQASFPSRKICRLHVRTKVICLAYLQEDNSREQVKAREVFQRQHSRTFFEVLNYYLQVLY